MLEKVINFEILTVKDAEDILSPNFNSTNIFYIANQLTFNPSFNYSCFDDGLNDAKRDWLLPGSISYHFLKSVEEGNLRIYPHRVLAVRGESE